MTEENAEILNICVLGDKKVGKTNFIGRFVEKNSLNNILNQNLLIHGLKMFT